MNSAVLVFAAIFVSSNIFAGAQDLSLNEVSMMCAQNVGVTPKDLTPEKHLEENVDPKLKCFHACMFKKLDMMLDDGKINTEVLLMSIAPQIPDQQKEELKKLFIECSKLTGENYCDTAFSVFKCTHPQMFQRSQ